MYNAQKKETIDELVNEIRFLIKQMNLNYIYFKNNEITEEMFYENMFEYQTTLKHYKKELSKLIEKRKIEEKNNV